VSDVRRMQVAGGEIAYSDQGDPEDPPIVLLHGSTASEGPWHDVRSMLSPWARVIAPQPRGDADASPRELADRVRDLLERLGVLRFAVAGEGDGGRVAQLLALDGGVDAMVLIGSPSLDDPDALSALEIPVLVALGEDDPELPATALAERFAEVLSMGSVALLPGRGHALFDEAPETVVPLVFQWLRSRYLKVSHAHEGGPVVVELGRRPREGT